MITIFSSIGWLFNFLVVFVWFFAGCAVSIYISYKNWKNVFTLFIIIIGIILSQPLSNYFLNQVIENLDRSSVYAFTAYSEITWRIELLYLAIPSAALLWFSFTMAEENEFLAKLLICISFIGFFSGLTQASTGLFSAESFFYEHGISVNN